MAELFNSISAFKAFVGGAINQTVDLDSLAPVIADTARRHLVPYLSMDFYNSLVAAAAGTPSAEEEALLPYVQRSLALLTMHEYAKVAAIEFGESGMFRIETDNRKSAYRYQEKQYSEYMLEKGYDALELMLRFLDNNIDDYPEWGASDAAEAHLSALLNYAEDIRLLLNIHCDRYTFETLKPIIAEVQHFGVERLLPGAFWQEFIAGYQLDDLSDSEITLLNHIRSAIAHRSYEEATRRMIVTIRSGRLYVQEDIGDQNSTNRLTPSGQSAGLNMIAHDIWSDRHTNRWKRMINDNKGDFALVFDEASGGTNTDADAWHINTEDEQAEVDVAMAARKDRPIFQM